jgi:hypothetical protein
MSNQKRDIVHLCLQESGIDLGRLGYRRLKCVAHVKRYNCSFRKLRDLCWQKKKADSLMLQVGLVDEKDFKVNDRDNDENENENDDDDDINNDFHFDVNVNDDNDHDNDYDDGYDDSITVMTSQATFSLLELCLNSA